MNYIASKVKKASFVQKKTNLEEARDILKNIILAHIPM